MLALIAVFWGGRGGGDGAIFNNSKNVPFFAFSCFMVLNNSKNISNIASWCRVGIEAGPMAEAGGQTTELRRTLVI